ncbi:MAG: hypothetical protein HRT71_19845 [Flavobacteriales bacterium]|nr:hypothetical protein [Flavobacteriales bacterium]
MGNWVVKGMASTANRFNIDSDTFTLRIKIFVYCCIAISFVKFVYEDIEPFLMRDSSEFKLQDYTYAFSNTLDAVAWIGLIILLDFETYFLSLNTSKTMDIFRAIGRYICYAIIAHTSFWYVSDVQDYDNSENNPLLITTLQEAFNNGYRLYQWNDTYYPITDNNLDSLGSGSEWFKYNKGIVTDRKGIDRAINYAWSSAIEMSLWLIIMILIEFKIWIENRKLNWSTLSNIASQISNLSYVAMLGGVCIYWVYIGQGYNAYDEFMWVIGYYLIEININDWREENKEERLKMV